MPSDALLGNQRYFPGTQGSIGHGTKGFFICSTGFTGHVRAEGLLQVTVCYYMASETCGAKGLPFGAIVCTYCCPMQQYMQHYCRHMQHCAWAFYFSLKVLPQTVQVCWQALASWFCGNCRHVTSLIESSNMLGSCAKQQ